MTDEAEANLLIDLFDTQTNLLCKICEKYLTISPLYCIDDFGTICGRCTSNARRLHRESNKFHKQTALEDFLINFNVPCSNKKYGCEMVLKWNEDVLDHESECPYKKEVCPLNYRQFFDDHGVEENCSWSGKSEAFVKHVEEDHEDLIKDNPFQMILEPIGHNYICFNRVQRQLVTIVLKYVEENLYYFMVMLHGTEGDSQCYSIELKIFATNEDKQILSLHKNNLEQLQGLANCLDTNSDSVFNEKMFKIDFTGIRDFMNFEGRLTLTFQLYRKSNDELKAIRNANVLLTAGNMSDEPDIDTMVLKSMECSKCILYMLGQIFKCKNGHRVCENCRSDNCTICKFEIDIRDDMLEKFVGITFSCANRSRGCTFVSKCEGEDHEMICEFRLVQCVYSNCLWSGPLNLLILHFQENHKSCLKEYNSDIPIRKLHLNQWFIDSIIFDDRLYFFNYKLVNSSIFIKVTHFQSESTKLNCLFKLSNTGRPEVCIQLLSECFSHNRDVGFEGAVEITPKMLEIMQIVDMKSELLYSIKIVENE